MAEGITRGLPIETELTFFKSNKGNAYLVLEDMPLSVFLRLPFTASVEATTYGHYDPVPMTLSKEDLLREYHLVAEEEIPQ